MRAVAQVPVPAVFALLPALLHDKEGREFTVRALHPRDRPALETFYDAFDPKRAAQGLPPEGQARVERWLNQILPNGTHLAVERGGHLVGHAMLLPMELPGVEEYAIFLAREVRGQGVGTRVGKLAVEVARATGAERLWLSVEPNNRAAVRSYEKVGFRFVAPTVYTSEVEMELPL
ncbi:MAG TPA: GNAT family N-acetyltransferase [Longimicrobiaceae bacterium]|nr:GNAT family N-acetyltransferase [Longimicrobiaceae bacterium]